MIAKELSDLLWRAIALAAGPPCPECGWYSGEHKTTVQHVSVSPEHRTTEGE